MRTPTPALPLVILAALGCAGEEPCPPGSSRQADGLCHLDDVEDTGGGTGGGEDGSDDGGVRNFPDWSAAEAEEALARVVAVGLPVSNDLTEAYYAYMAHGDADCPGDLDYGLSSPEETCTAQSGATYTGFASWITEEGETPDGGWQSMANMGQASFRITDPDGLAFTAGGSWGHRIEVHPDGSTQLSDAVQGTFLDTGAEGWLGAGTSVSLALAGEEIEGLLRVELEGGLVLDGDALFFDELAMSDAICEGAPVGRVLLRHPEGPWAAVELGEDCAPCGTLRWDDDPDTDLGEACLDLDATLAPYLAEVLP